MKKLTMLGLATLALALSGCKGKQDKLADLQMELAAARQSFLADCPNLDAKGNPDAFGKPNNTPRCLDEQKHIVDLEHEVTDKQREAAQ